MRPGPRNNFFARRWRGEVETSRLLWRDMFLTGSAVNVAATVVALILAARGHSPVLALALHFAPLPYNLFLFAAVGRSRRCTPLSVALAAVWLAVMMVA